MLTIINPVLIHYTPVLLSVVVVGFKDENVTVPEGQESVELCASILIPDPDELSDEVAIIANVYLESDTATSKADGEAWVVGLNKFCFLILPIFIFFYAQNPYQFCFQFSRESTHFCYKGH